MLTKSGGGGPFRVIANQQHIRSLIVSPWKRSSE